MEIETIEDEIRFDTDSLTEASTNLNPLQQPSSSSSSTSTSRHIRDRTYHLHRQSTSRSSNSIRILSPLPPPQQQLLLPSAQSIDVDLTSLPEPPEYSGLHPEPVIIRGNGNLTIFGLNNRFSTDFPPSLQARLAPEEYIGTVERINSILNKALRLQLKWVVFGCLCCCCTLGCSLWPVICLSKSTRSGIEKLLDWENSHLYGRLGLRWKLVQMHADSSSMLEYVLVIEFVPKKYVYKPD